MRLDMNEVRPCHYLKHNKRTTVPSNIMAVDTEANRNPYVDGCRREAHTLRLWAAIAGRQVGKKWTRHRQAEGKSKTEFWQFLDTRLSSRQPLWVFGHGIGYDLTLLGLWTEIDQGNCELFEPSWPLWRTTNPADKGKRKFRGMLANDDPPTIVVVRRHGCTVRFVDTRNYWNCSLKELGENTGCPKGDMPADDASDEAWMTYCVIDAGVVIGSVNKLMDMWRTLDLGTFRSTAAGLAWNCLRHRFLDKKVLIHGHRKTLALERQAYRGAEVRCFYVGEVMKDEYGNTEFLRKSKWETSCSVIGPVYVLDVNSLYPYVMSTFKFPVKLLDYQKPRPDDKCYNPLDLSNCVARVSIASNTDCYPAIDNGKRLFARGTFETALAGPELAYAYICSHITDIHEIATYELANLFEPFMSYWWDKRKEFAKAGLNAWAFFAKTIMNSLSGKWAQRANRWENATNVPAKTLWGQWWEGTNGEKLPELYRSIAVYSQRYAQGGESRDSFPAIAAFITAYGRQHMRQLRDVVGVGNILYQDTDSLHVTEYGYRKLLATGKVYDEEFGCLKLVGTFETARYYGLKHYCLDGHEVCGAVSRKATKDASGAYRYEQFERLSSTLCRKPDDTVHVKEIVKHVSDSHPDGSVGEHGWVVPHWIGVKPSGTLSDGQG